MGKNDHTIRTSINFVGPRGYLLIEEVLDDRPNQFTVYEIPIAGRDRDAQIIGRSLDEKACRTLIIERNRPSEPPPESKHREPRAKRTPRPVKRASRPARVRA